MVFDFDPQPTEGMVRTVAGWWPGSVPHPLYTSTEEWDARLLAAPGFHENPLVHTDAWRPTDPVGTYHGVPVYRAAALVLNPEP